MYGLVTAQTHIKPMFFRIKQRTIGLKPFAGKPLQVD